MENFDINLANLPKLINIFLIVALGIFLRNVSLAYSLLITVLGVIGIIGFLIGYVLSKKNSVPIRFIKVISWLNLVAWLIPFVGILVSTFTGSISGNEKLKAYRFIPIVSGVGSVLSVAYAIIGVYIKIGF